MKMIFVVDERTEKLQRVVIKDCPKSSEFLMIFQSKTGEMVGMKTCEKLILTGPGADAKAEILTKAFEALSEIQPC